MFNFTDIKTDESILYEYCDFINTLKGKTIKDIIDILHSEVLNFDFDTSSVNLRDKGYLGKLIKQSIFGLHFNENLLFQDKILNLRVTNLIKRKRNNIVVAKERLTLKNIKDYDNILDSNEITELDFYPQICNNLLFTILNENVSNTEEILNLKFMGIYNLNIPELDKFNNIDLQEDLRKIKNVIIDKTFSSIGQKKLHIHKRGNKGSKTRALGFKNTFISDIIKADLIKQKYKLSWQTRNLNDYQITIKDDLLILTE